MIKDLFSHKIHSSAEFWPEKLVELATIFGDFDGKPYEFNELEKRLRKISPRTTSFQSRSGRTDVAKFRDEISAYSAYLGLYFIELTLKGWIIRLSESTKYFLLKESPDVSSFVTAQLLLFQYPNGVGAAHRPNFRIQANARDRTLGFIDNRIHLSPLRLIAVALSVDANLRKRSVHDAAISYDEIFAMANTPSINQRALPKKSVVARVLTDIRAGRVPVHTGVEKRFHILNQTNLFSAFNEKVRLRDAADTTDAAHLKQKLDSICNIDLQFEGFDECSNGKELADVVAGGAWGRYFDCYRVLTPNELLSITDDSVDVATINGRQSKREASQLSKPVVNYLDRTYPLREQKVVTGKPMRQPSKRIRADPEITLIKQQRRNLIHRELVDQMAKLLRGLGAVPLENEHIDLCALLPKDKFFIFEMKSGGEFVLEQIRKGVSQLYEYRYRYRDTIDTEDVKLCLVLPSRPVSIPWVIDYLCLDRKIGVCWFDSNGSLDFPSQCSKELGVFS